MKKNVGFIKNRATKHIPPIRSRIHDSSSEFSSFSQHLRDPDESFSPFKLNHHQQAPNSKSNPNECLKCKQFQTLESSLEQSQQISRKNRAQKKIERNYQYGLILGSQKPQQTESKLKAATKKQVVTKQSEIDVERVKVVTEVEVETETVKTFKPEMEKKTIPRFYEELEEEELEDERLEEESASGEDSQFSEDGFDTLKADIATLKAEKENQLSQTGMVKVQMANQATQQGTIKVNSAQTEKETRNPTLRTNPFQSSETQDRILKAKGGVAFQLDTKPFCTQNGDLAQFQYRKTQRIFKNTKEEARKRRQRAKVYDRYSRFRLFAH